MDILFAQFQNNFNLIEFHREHNDDSIRIFFRSGNVLSPVDFMTSLICDESINSLSCNGITIDGNLL